MAVRETTPRVATVQARKIFARWRPQLPVVEHAGACL
jgi:hypothetical protein